MLISLTVGKVDAGVAVLLTEDKRLIEFPSILLPPNISSGSIVDINVSRNHASETISQQKFGALQDAIFQKYGTDAPQAPVLRCRNATQTSIVLEWDPIVIATSALKSLTLYRNGAKVGTIPKPLQHTATKISGLSINTEYTFHLVLRTTAGTHTSEKLLLRTHAMTNLSGITVTPGVMPAPQRQALSKTIERIGAKLVDTVRIETTHFICTEGRGQEWDKAVEMSIPVVRPEWLDGCEREGGLVGVRAYYLNADPRLRQVGPGQAIAMRRRISETSIKPADSVAPSPRSLPADAGPEIANTRTAIAGSEDADAQPTGRTTTVGRFQQEPYGQERTDNNDPTQTDDDVAALHLGHESNQEFSLDRMNDNNTSQIRNLTSSDTKAQPTAAQSRETSRESPTSDRNLPPNAVHAEHKDGDNTSFADVEI